MEVIDYSTWTHREVFELYSNVDFPFYSVTIPMDVTEVKAFSKKNNISFYYLMIWLCTKAANSIPQFRLRMRDGKIVRLDQVDPNFTDMRKGEEQYHISVIPWEKNVKAFCEKAKAQNAKQKQLLESEETDNFIYYSCTPWYDFTAATNPHTLDNNDFIPRIVWGKYYEEKDRLWVHMSFEMNHKMIDGYHIGLLKEAIDKEIAQLPNMAL